MNHLGIRNRYKVTFFIALLFSFASISALLIFNKFRPIDATGTLNSVKAVLAEDELSGDYSGTLVITAPVNIGVVDVTVQLTSTEGASTGFVLDSTTSHFSDNPLVNASITGSTDGITPTFTIHSQPFVEVIAAQSSTQPISVTRAFTIEGEVLNNGSILSGTYIETIAGYTHKPLQISGDILLSKPQLSQVGSVTLVIPKETLAEGESMEITATVLDQDGQPLVGELVTFFGGLGTLNPDNGVTDAQGQVRVQYTAGPSSGQAQLQALAGSANGSASVQINGPDPGDPATATPTPTPTQSPDSPAPTNTPTPDPSVQQPALTATNATIAPGSNIIINGTNLPKSTELTVLLGNSPLGTVTTDANGNAVFTVTTNQAPEGNYIITIQGQSDLSLPITISTSATMQNPTAQGPSFAIPRGVQPDNNSLFLPIIRGVSQTTSAANVNNPNANQGSDGTGDQIFIPLVGE